MKQLNFSKEDGLWYIVLPTWTGPKSALLMVAGADTLLDHISKGGNTVSLCTHENEVEDCDIVISKIVGGIPVSGGAIYNVKGSTPIWLCDVTKFVYGKFPKKLWIKIL